MDAHEPDWILVHDWDGGKTYLDRSSITRKTSLVQVLVKYCESIPGTDKRNGKRVKELFMLEEYDTATRTFRIHKVVFAYVDGTNSDPLVGDLTWMPASAGHGKTLDFLCGDQHRD